MFLEQLFGYFQMLDFKARNEMIFQFRVIAALPFIFFKKYNSSSITHQIRVVIRN